MGDCGLLMVTGKLSTQFACILSLRIQLHLRETSVIWIRAQTHLYMAKHSVAALVEQEKNEGQHEQKQPAKRGEEKECSQKGSTEEGNETEKGERKKDGNAKVQM